MQPCHRVSWTRNLLMGSDLNLNPSFKVKHGHQNPYILLIIIDIKDLKPTFEIAWARNLWAMFRFDLGPFLQGVF